MSNARIYGLMYSGKRSFRCWKSDEKGPVAAVITIEWTSPSAASAEIEAEWAIQRSLSREVSLVIATRFCNCGRHGAYILSWRKAGHFFKSVRSKLYYETSAQVASKSETYEKRLRVIFIFARYLKVTVVRIGFLRFVIFFQNDAENVLYRLSCIFSPREIKIIRLSHAVSTQPRFSPFSLSSLQRQTFHHSQNRTILESVGGDAEFRKA